MTPIDIAEKYCANWQDGICSGIGFRADGSFYRFRSEGCKCLLRDNLRCSYLESSVLLQGKNKEWIQGNPGEAKKFEDGIDRYWRRHSGIAGLALRKRLCPDCGIQIGPRKRYCEKCAGNRARESDKKYHEGVRLT
jgi:hypothetical protein